MKNRLLVLLMAFTATFAFGHGDIQIGPGGGRILEFSKDETMHGEVTVKDGKFHIALLDKDMKAVTIADQVLTATGGNRDNPEKLTVEQSDGHFVVPTVKEGDWIIIQYREGAGAKPVTARLHYDTAICPECKDEEWICACSSKKK